MAKGDLEAIASKAKDLSKMMKKNKQLDAWVQSKITKADDYIGSVHDFLKNGRQEVDEPMTKKTFSKLREQLDSICTDCDDSIYGSVEEDFEPTGEEQYEDWDLDEAKDTDMYHYKNSGTSFLKGKSGTYVGHTHSASKGKGANILKHNKTGKYYAAGGSSTAFTQKTTLHDTPEEAAKAYHDKHNEKLAEANETPLSYMLKNPGKKLPMHLDPNRPFDPDPPKKNPSAVAGKYGQGFSTAKHLAKQGMASVKEDETYEAANLAQQAAIAIAMKKAGKKPKNVDEAKYQKLTPRQKFTNSLARAGYDVNASSKRIQDLLAKQKKEREEREKQGVAEGDSGAKYKVKSIGKDSKGDYYMSPSTGKKVYKSGVNKGDHENPKTGEIKKRVAEGSLTEMDKSSPQPGRDGKVSHKTYGSRDNYKLGDPERMAKQVSAEKAKKDALDILKKQGVAEGIELQEAEKNGRTVQLNKPFRTSDGKGKFAVYTKNDKGNVVKVNFGDTTGLTIKTSNPDRRRNFRARHNCDNPGPRHKARYWACKSWSKDTVSAGLGT